jgi:hypothetical protein
VIAHGLHSCARVDRWRDPALGSLRLPPRSFRRAIVVGAARFVVACSQRQRPHPLPPVLPAATVVKRRAKHYIAGGIASRRTRCAAPAGARSGARSPVFHEWSPFADRLDPRACGSR